MRRALLESLLDAGIVDGSLPWRQARVVARERVENARSVARCDGAHRV